MALAAGRKRRRDEALDLVGLDDLADRLPTELSQGQRKLVGVARALARAPRVRVLDEPAAGLDTTESSSSGASCAGRRRGTAVLLVDHDMGLVLSVCDHVLVLEFGEVIATGTPDEMRRDPRVVEAYLGGAGPSRGRRARQGGRMSDALLSIEGLSAGYDGAPVVRDISLHVGARRGRGPARPQRGGQDDDAAGHLGPRASARGRIVFDGADAARSRRRPRAHGASPTCPRTAACSSA